MIELLENTRNSDIKVIKNKQQKIKPEFPNLKIYLTVFSEAKKKKRNENVEVHIHSY